MSQKNQQLAAEHKAGLQSINPLKERISELESDYERYNEIFKQMQQRYIDAHNQLSGEFESLKQENQQLRQGRGAAGLLADKTKISGLKEEIAELKKTIDKKNEKIKDLKRRLALAGRPAIPSDKVNKIIELKKSGMGYSRIAHFTGVSKSTVSKYVTRHLKEGRAKSDAPVVHIN